MLKTPAVGVIVAHFALVRFCRMLGTLLSAGVPLVTALRVAKEAIGNQTLTDTVAKGIEEVQRGESLARALGAAERLFPSTVVEMIAIAEETGRLDKELVRLSISYESELDRKLRMLVSLAEPLLLFLMAGLIGTIVLWHAAARFRFAGIDQMSISTHRAMPKRSLTMKRASALRRGFTLVELMLVMVILAVLAAVVVPKFTGRSEQARIAVAKTDIKTIESRSDRVRSRQRKVPHARRRTRRPGHQADERQSLAQRWLSEKTPRRSLGPPVPLHLPRRQRQVRI